MEKKKYWRYICYNLSLYQRIVWKEKKQRKPRKSIPKIRTFCRKLLKTCREWGSSVCFLIVAVNVSMALPSLTNQREQWPSDGIQTYCNIFCIITSSASSNWFQEKNGSFVHEPRTVDVELLTLTDRRNLSIIPEKKKKSIKKNITTQNRKSKVCSFAWQEFQLRFDFSFPYPFQALLPFFCLTFSQWVSTPQWGPVC